MMKRVKKHRRPCAVVLGGYVNGYNIVRELTETGVCDIVLLHCQAVKPLAAYSRYVDEVVQFRKGCHESLLSALRHVNKRFDYLVLFPTDDIQCAMLAEIYESIREYCFVPFDPETQAYFADKIRQYQACEALGVPCPQTKVICDEVDLEELAQEAFPILVKPVRREESGIDGLFRNLPLNTPEELAAAYDRLASLLGRGVVLMASEVIPGNGGDIYSYMAYRDSRGRIVNEWVGKKLAQFPDDFGVFASASNVCPDIVAEQGRALVHGMNLRGISQPEFKYDRRDGTYKLTEINLRSMMWHRLGHRCGVHLHATQYADALGLDVPEQTQSRGERVNLVYMKHELLNLACRKGYWRTFVRNCLGQNRRTWAVWARRDPYPFLIDSMRLAGTLARMLGSKLFSSLRISGRLPECRQPSQVRISAFEKATCGYEE